MYTLQDNPFSGNLETINRMVNKRGIEVRQEEHSLFIRDRSGNRFVSLGYDDHARRFTLYTNGTMLHYEELTQYEKETADMVKLVHELNELAV